MSDKRSHLSTSYRVTDRTLIIDCGGIMRVLSSAPMCGGLQRARYILNHQVCPNLDEARAGRTAQSTTSGEHPSRTLRQVGATLGIHELCVGLMTAVPMTQLVVA